MHVEVRIGNSAPHSAGEKPPLETIVSKRSDNLPRAREMAAQGMPDTDIAEALDVSRNTIRNWRDHDREANGIDWEEERRKRVSSQSPLRVLQILEERRNALATDGPEDGDVYGWADALQKVDTVITRMRERIGGPQTVLAGLHAFSAWAAHKHSDVHVRELRELVAECIDDLRTNRFKLPEGAAL